MCNYLEKFDMDVGYIHAQRRDGHGLHTVMNQITQDIDLLIVVDSSSSSWKECKEIKNMGIDVIVIDHHPLENPNYYCILVNPQQEDCKYPNKHISGSALTWQVCRVLDDKLGTNYASGLVDLAGVGLISDMMCMKTLENRAIASLALDNMKNIGLTAILDNQKLLKKRLTTTDIGFKVSSMLNAAARMNQIELALELLTTKTYTRADEIVKQIANLNKKRKTTQTNHTINLQDRINTNQKIIIYLDHNKEISKSFSGLIANELSNTYQRPVLILSPDEGNQNTYTGSYRSYNGFDLKSFFESLDLVESTGGHSGAGGCGVKVENLEKFIEQVQEAAKDIVFESGIEYELELDLSDIDEEAINEINEFYRISGTNFPMGKFLVSGIPVNGVKVMGAGEDTVQVQCDGLNLMKFKTNKEYAEKFPVLGKVNAVGTLNVNKYYNFQLKKNVITNQLFLDDFKVVG